MFFNLSTSQYQQTGMAPVLSEARLTLAFVSMFSSAVKVKVQVYCAFETWSRMIRSSVRRHIYQLYGSYLSQKARGKPFQAHQKRHPRKRNRKRTEATMIEKNIKNTYCGAMIECSRILDNGLPYSGFGQRSWMSNASGLVGGRGRASCTSSNPPLQSMPDRPESSCSAGKR